MKKLKLIKDSGILALKKLNEGQVLKNPDKYVFQGVFTLCSTPEHKVINRNGRIYMEKEVLRHLGYLRDMIKENSGRILGELDHPEGRFDVQMKEASHMITDLWYDDNTKCVMGRLEVLDTPNGKTLKSLIDAGFPLYVSSRAAGDVNEKTKEVEIAQIFTYDVVCTPGFKEARLERVNESLLTDRALKYINESVADAKEILTKKDLINVPIEKINESAIAKFNKITISDVCKPLNEGEDEAENNNFEEGDKLNDNDQDQSKFFKVQNTKGVKDLKEDEDSEEGDSEDDSSNDEEDDSETDSKENKESDEELSDEEKEANRELILSIVGLDSDGEPTTDVEEDSDNEDDIVDIEGVKDEDDEEDSEDDEESEDGEEDSEEANESEDTDNTIPAEKKKALRKETKADMDEIDALIASVEKAEGVKESIIRRYPFAISLSEANFSKFASLRPKLKKRCADFIEENGIFDIHAINELWTTPLREDKKMQQNWLKLASQADIDLYVAAPLEVQNAIEESAKYVILETPEDVDMFWHRTGLRQQAAQRLINEQRMEEYRQNISEQRQFQANNVLGYNMDFIKMTEQWLNNN